MSFPKEEYSSPTSRSRIRIRDFRRTSSSPGAVKVCQKGRRATLPAIWLSCPSFCMLVSAPFSRSVEWNPPGTNGYGLLGISCTTHGSRGRRPDTGRHHSEGFGCLWCEVLRRGRSCSTSRQCCFEASSGDQTGLHASANGRFWIKQCGTSPSNGGP